jgi:hypothetical protein
MGDLKEAIGFGDRQRPEDQRSIRLKTAVFARGREGCPAADGAFQNRSGPLCTPSARRLSPFARGCCPLTPEVRQALDGRGAMGVESRASVIPLICIT